MSVYNDAARVGKAVDSILSQTFRELELIVVDDGSTDGTASVLDTLSEKDSRMRVIHQQNMGLTRALIRGCTEARGELIARQDAGDYSHAERLSRQCLVFDADESVVLTSCGTVFVDDEGREAFRVCQIGDELQAGIDTLDVKRIAGPSHHGACMFRKSAYIAVGGYRAPFVVAQDIDLWLRLSEQGRCVGTEDFDYFATVDIAGISARRASLQKALMEIAIECAKERRTGVQEQSIHAIAQFVGSMSLSATSARKLTAAHHYFLGGSFYRTDRTVARLHYWRAVSAWPLHVRAWVRLLGTLA